MLCRFPSWLPCCLTAFGTPLVLSLRAIRIHNLNARAFLIEKGIMLDLILLPSVSLGQGKWGGEGRPNFFPTSNDICCWRGKCPEQCLSMQLLLGMKNKNNLLFLPSLPASSESLETSSLQLGNLTGCPATNISCHRHNATRREGSRAEQK